MAPVGRFLNVTCLAVLIPALVAAGALLAQGQPLVNAGQNAQPQLDFKGGWQQFKDVPTLLEILGGLLLAAFLALLIAYHPKSYGKAATLEEVEQPKTFIMYAVVGALIAKVVLANINMALVIFGLGGLLRFRTDVGAAKDTGRVILVTIVGLLCGLNYFPHAVLGTAFGWLLIYLLDALTVYRIVIKGLEGPNLTHAGQAYQELLLGKGCRILSEKKNFAKGQVAFVFRAPSKLSREVLDEAFLEVPAELQGAVDWEAT